MSSLRIQPLSTQIYSQLSNLSPSTILLSHKRRTRISCNSGVTDAELAYDLAKKVANINTHLVQTEEAMKMSRELLFGEFCKYLSLKEDEARRKWKKIDEDEKWVLVKGFVAEWGSDFHPLSARSAKKMVEEYLQEEKNPSENPPPSSVFLFPGLKRMMGFSQNK